MIMSQPVLRFRPALLGWGLILLPHKQTGLSVDHSSESSYPHIKMATATRTPARDRAIPLLPKALAEGWTVTRLAKEARVSRETAALLLRDGSERSRRSIGSELDREGNRAVVVARQVRDGQIAQAHRIEALTEKALETLEVKAKKGELSIRDLGDLAKLRSQHWQHVKDMAGLNLAEKLAVAKAKGDAQGRGFAGALLDATVLELGDGVFTVSSDS